MRRNVRVFARVVLTLVLHLYLGMTLVACSGDTAESLVLSAQSLTAKKDHRGAVVQYKAAIQKNPNNPELRLALGTALVDAGDPVNAILELRKALDQQVSADQVVPELARAMLLNGETKRLTAAYDDIVLAEPHAAARLKAYLATAWLSLGDKARAEQAIAAALAAQPGFGPAVILQARLAAAQGDPARALAAVERLLAEQPELAEAWHLKGEILAQTAPDTAAAAAAYGKALAANRTYVPSHLALVQLYLAKKDFKAAKAQAAALREALPKHPQATFIDAQVAFHEGDLARAREHMQELLRISPNHVGVLMLAGSIEGRSGSLMLAQNYFSKAVQKDPDLFLARRNLAQTYLRLGQPAKGLETLQPALAKKLPIADLYGLAGEAQLQMGKLSAAETSFQHASKLAPDNLRLRSALALSALARGEDRTAFSELNKLSEQDTEITADMTIVAVRMNRREYKKALDAALAMVKRFPREPVAANTLGQVYVASGNLPKAREAFEAALKLDPRLFVATANLAALDVAEKNPQAAHARFEAAIALDPRNHLARMSLAELRATQGAPAQEVNALLAEAIKATPGEPAARLMLINRLLADRAYKEALNAAQDAVAAVPNDQNLLDAFGRALAESGDRQQAISVFRRLTNLDVSSGLPFLRLADLYKAMGDTAAAETNLRKALDVQPEVMAAQAGLVDLLVSTNRLDDALDVARRTQKRQPDQPSGYLFEAAVQMRKRSPEGAIAAFRKGLSALPDDSELAVALHKGLLAGNRTGEADRFADRWVKDHPQDLSFEYQLALSAILRNQLPVAEKRLRAVLSKRPDHVLALNNLAWLLVVLEKPAGAVDLARKANAIMPNRPSLMDTLAMALAAEKQVSAALTVQREAVALSPHDTGLRLNLAKIAILSGDKDLARKELKALDAVGSSLPTRDEVLKLMASL